jgi:osmotically-inducible protein OsmY
MPREDLSAAGPAVAAVMGGLALLGLGAGLMYYFDPVSGRRRRALVRDAFVGFGHDVRDEARTLTARLRDQGRGMQAAVRSLPARVFGEDVTDRVLAERVRSALGRAVSHPGSIAVSAREGRVHLSGAILAREMDTLVKTVASVPGVRDFEHDLDVRETAGNVPGLQG